jgi:hypothetical protein
MGMTPVQSVHCATSAVHQTGDRVALRRTLVMAGSKTPLVTCSTVLLVDDVDQRGITNEQLQNVDDLFLFRLNDLTLQDGIRRTATT